LFLVTNGIPSRFSIRAMCGLDSEKNCVHGSDSLESAAREISFFFGEADSGWFLHYLFHNSEDYSIKFLTLIFDNAETVEHDEL
jgi:hypothetical protein